MEGGNEESDLKKKWKEREVVIRDRRGKMDSWGGRGDKRREFENRLEGRKREKRGDLGPRPGAKPLHHRVCLEVITLELNGDGGVEGLNTHTYIHICERMHPTYKRRL